MNRYFAWDSWEMFLTPSETRGPCRLRKTRHKTMYVLVRSRVSLDPIGTDPTGDLHASVLIEDETIHKTPHLTSATSPSENSTCVNAPALRNTYSCRMTTVSGALGRVVLQ